MPGLELSQSGGVYQGADADMIRKPATRRANRPVIIEDLRKGFYTSLGYRSARVATREGRSYTSYPGYRHDERDRKSLIAQSRDFMRNNPIYKGMINRAVGYIVGNGFELQVNSNSANTNNKIEGLWRDWLKRPEIRNILSGSETGRMVCREVMVAGDTAALLTDKALIQIFEAEQIAGKTTRNNGIEKDRYGGPKIFNLSEWKSNRVDTQNATKVDAKNVLYIANPERPSQIRGVPAAQSSFPMLHRINDVCDSEAIAMQMLSRLAVSITRDQGAEEGYTQSREDPNKTTEQTEGDLATRMTELDYAIMFWGKQGEEIKGIERNIPGKNFGESLRMFLRILGLPLGMPLEIILLDWTKSNYSQSRAVLQQAFQMFGFWQNKLADFFYTPLFEWRLDAWRGQGLIGKNTKVDYNWIKQTFPWIDQLKEAQAYATQVERGFITHGQVCKSLNTDRAEVIEQREKEVRDAIKRARKIEDDTGEKVSWKIFAGLKETPDKAVLAEPVEKEAEEDKEDKEDEE